MSLTLPEKILVEILSNFSVKDLKSGIERDLDLAISLKDSFPSGIKTIKALLIFYPGMNRLMNEKNMLNWLKTHKPNFYPLLSYGKGYKWLNKNIQSFKELLE